MLGFQTYFNGKNMEAQSAGIGAKSYAKISGEAIKNVPIYIEVAVAENDSFNNLYQKDSLNWSDGFKNFGVDMLSDPIYYLDGQGAGKTYLGHFKAGFNSPYVNLMTGYKYAKLTTHKNVSWTTVDGEWEAGYNQTGGYAEWSLGSALQKIGDNITIHATIAPNKTADRAGGQYGLYSFINAQIGDHYVDFQYNGAYGNDYKTIYDNIYEADFIGGYKGDFGPLTVKANMLYNVWGSVKVNDTYKIPYNPSTSDVSGVMEGKDFLYNSAANVQLTYTDLNYGVTVGYRYRGAQASMMYVEQGADGHTDISDQLGSPNTMRAWLSGYVNPISLLKVSLDGYADLAFNNDYSKLWMPYQKPYNDSKNIQFEAKPQFDLDLEDFTSYKSSFSVYGEGLYNTSDKDKFTRGTASNQFVLNVVGAKFNIQELSDTFKDVSVYYAYDNKDANYLFNTLLATVSLPQDFGVQAAVGMRTANEGQSDPDMPFGFSLGVSKVFRSTVKTNTYAQFVYGIDPYKGFGDGQDNINLDGYRLSNGQGAFNNGAALRIGMRWDF
jgi:hypothetical protein